jgi:Tfp pilus assembly major pilin PilA
MLKRPKRLPQAVAQTGFSTIELLTTLVVASIFLLVFYQIYVAADVVATRTSQLAAVNKVTYQKLQQYENTNFQLIATPGGTSPAQIEDFAAEIPSDTPGPVTAIVNTALLTPTLKAVNVKTTFGNNGERIVEYTVYIQESGVGR